MVSSQGQRFFLLATVALFLLGGGAEAQAPRASYSDVFSTRLPGTSAGRTFAVDWVNPEDPSAKPYGISHILVALHPGSRFETAAVPRCGASDAALMASGEAACPPESKLGNDLLVADTGFPEPGRFVTLASTIFNADGEVIFLATEEESGSRFVVRAKASGNTLDIPLPFVPGTPPDGAAPTEENGTWLNAVGPSGRGFFTTPPICPERRRWTNRVTYTYRDGVVQTARSTTPCVKGRSQGRFRCRGERATLAGSRAGDLIHGTPRRDVITARGGDDRIRGGGGADVICAGRGGDRAKGGSGDDWIHGGRGDDRELGGRGRDRLYGGRGRDRLNGGRGDDVCRGRGDRKLRC